MAANDDDSKNILTLEAIDEIADWGEKSFAAKSAATPSAGGLMSAADKEKLDGIEPGAKAHQAPSASEITAALGYVPVSAAQKGAAGGVAELDASGKVPSSQLPSYVDDVLEYEGASAFPAAGEAGKIYVDAADNRTYRWSGSAYVEVAAGLALGETSASAYRGDRGKAAYDHAAEGSGGHSGHALTPASVAATGPVSGSSVSDSVGSLADLRESVSQPPIVFRQVDFGKVDFNEGELKTVSKPVPAVEGYAFKAIAQAWSDSDAVILGSAVHRSNAKNVELKARANRAASGVWISAYLMYVRDGAWA